MPLLKPKLIELEGAAVFAYGADRALLKTVGLFGADLDDDLDVGAHLARQALNDLFDDEAHVLVHPLGIDLDPADLSPGGLAGPTPRARFPRPVRWPGICGR